MGKGDGPNPCHQNTGQARVTARRPEAEPRGHERAGRCAAAGGEPGAAPKKLQGRERAMGRKRDWGRNGRERACLGCVGREWQRRERVGEEETLDPKGRSSQSTWRKTPNRSCSGRWPSSSPAPSPRVAAAAAGRQGGSGRAEGQGRCGGGDACVRRGQRLDWRTGPGGEMGDWRGVAAVPGPVDEEGRGNSRLGFFKCGPLVSRRWRVIGWNGYGWSSPIPMPVYPSGRVCLP